MGFGLDDIKRGASGAVRTAVRAGGDAKDAIGRAVPDRVEGLGRDALKLASKVSFADEALGEVADAGRSVANVVRHVPECVPTWKLIGHAIRSGERTLLPGTMPAYEKVDPAALQGAVARGQGRTYTQGLLTSASGSKHEPINLVVTGSKADLARALRSRGWVENDAAKPLNYLKQFLAAVTRYDRVTEGPMSNMYLDGKLPTMAFSKNSDYNLARDHMRIYHLGKDAAGQDRWGIAATRDTAATITVKKPEREGFWPWQWKMETPGFGHVTDHDLDGERDLIMHDLLGSKQVADWAAVRGVAPGATVGKAPDGRQTLNKYTTDGRVYEVTLG